MNRRPVAVPEILCSLFASQNFDRCHSLASLPLPPAAVGSLPSGYSPSSLRVGLITRCALMQMQFLKRKKEQPPIGGCSFFWLREPDLNRRPPGYEPDELPDCSIPRYAVLLMLEHNTIDLEGCQQVFSTIGNVPYGWGILYSMRNCGGIFLRKKFCSRMQPACAASGRCSYAKGAFPAR